MSATTWVLRVCPLHLLSTPVFVRVSCCSLEFVSMTTFIQSNQWVCRCGRTNQRADKSCTGCHGARDDTEKPPPPCGFTILYCQDTPLANLFNIRKDSPGVAPLLRNRGWKVKEDPESLVAPEGVADLCPLCRGACNTWIGRLDNAVASIRSFGKEGSMFRREVSQFILLLSDAACMVNTSQFAKFSDKNRTKVVNEKHVIGTIIDSARETPGYE